MDYIYKNLEYKQSRNTRPLIVQLLLTIIVIQAIVTCGTSPQVYVPIALAISHQNCVNPAPPNNGASASPVPATPGIIVINEVLTSPQSLWNCAASTPNDSFNLKNAWVEIYNPQNQPFDLYAAHAIIFEDQNIQGGYHLPFGSIIAAHGFLVVFPFTNSPSDASIKLSSVHLLISQVFVDQVSIPPLPVDTSYARIPDGSNNWQIMTIPTIAGSNTTETAKTGNGNNKQNHTTKNTSKSTKSGGTSNNKTGAETPATGAQPTWNALRLPPSGVNNAEATQRNSSSAPVSSTFDPFKQILFPLFIVVSSFVLLWGWRLYSRKKGT